MSLSLWPKLVLTILMIPLGLVSLWMIRATWHFTANCWQALRARKRAYDKLAPGPVVIRGNVVPIDIITSRETGKRGVYLAYTVDRWQRTATLGGLAGQWVRAEQDAQAAPFELSDGHVSVLVQPRQATVIVPHEVSVFSLPDGTLASYREEIIVEGEELIVMGTVSLQGGFDPSSGYRGHSYRTVIQTPPDGSGLVIASPRLLIQTLMVKALARAMVAALALTGLALALFALF